jgi:hypothetical protein
MGDAGRTWLWSQETLQVKRRVTGGGVASLAQCAAERKEGLILPCFAGPFPEDTWRKDIG